MTGGQKDKKRFGPVDQYQHVIVNFGWFLWNNHTKCTSRPVDPIQKAKTMKECTLYSGAGKMYYHLCGPWCLVLLTYLAGQGRHTSRLGVGIPGWGRGKNQSASLPQKSSWPAGIQAMPVNLEQHLTWSSWTSTFYLKHLDGVTLDELTKSLTPQIKLITWEGKLSNNFIKIGVNYIKMLNSYENCRSVVRTWVMLMKTRSQSRNQNRLSPDHLSHSNKAVQGSLHMRMIVM